MQEAPPAPPAAPRELHAFSSEENARIRAVQHFVQRAARKQGVDPTLVNAVIWIESNFQPRAHGQLGPRGLMQLMPRTARYAARELHRKYRPYDADFNIQAGTFYLGRMLALFHGDVKLALAAYNAGPAPAIAARDSGAPLPGQIQDYVDSVLMAQRAFQQRDFGVAAEHHKRRQPAAAPEHAAPAAASASPPPAASASESASSSP